MFNWRRRKVEETPPVLDESYLERLIGHLGEDTVRELLSDGLLELTDRVETLSTLSDDDNREAARKLMHDITGMSGHLGLSRLSRVASEAERGLRDESVKVLPTTEAFHETVPPALAAIRYFLDGTSPD